MTRSPYNMSGSTVVYGPYDSQLYNTAPPFHYSSGNPNPNHNNNLNNNNNHNTSFKNENATGYSTNDYGNSNSNYGQYDRNQSYSNGSYNSGGNYKTSNYNGQNGNKQTGGSKRNSGVNCSLGSGKSPLKHYSPGRSYNSPVRNYAHRGGNHPSTPKSSNTSATGYTKRDYHFATVSNTSTNNNNSSNNNGGFFGNVGNDVVSSRTFKHLHGQQPHLVAKSVNGVTVMAYPAPLMVTTTSLSQSNLATTMMNVSAKDHKLVQGDHFPNAEAMIRGHTSMASPMTPPHTPLALTGTDNASNHTKKSADSILAIKKLTL